MGRSISHLVKSLLELLLSGNKINVNLLIKYMDYIPEIILVQSDSHNNSNEIVPGKNEIVPGNNEIAGMKYSQATMK